MSARRNGPYALDHIGRINAIDETRKHRSGRVPAAINILEASDSREEQR
jgi:hypothetical protein